MTCVHQSSKINNFIGSVPGGMFGRLLPTAGEAAAKAAAAGELGDLVFVVTSRGPRSWPGAARVISPPASGEGLHAGWQCWLTSVAGLSRRWASKHLALLDERLAVRGETLPSRVELFVLQASPGGGAWGHGGFWCRGAQCVDPSATSLRLCGPCACASAAWLAGNHRLHA